MLGGCDDGFVGVVVGEVDVGLLLDRGVVPAVVDAEGYEVDVVAFYGASFDCCVLRFEVASKLGPVMSAVGFGEDAKVPRLVLGELGVEGLEQCPDVRGRGDGTGD